MKPDPSDTNGRLPVVWLLVATGVTLAGLALRLLAARGELWLDEVWSLKLAIDADSILDILTMVNVDNNHLLNTIWLYLLGESQNEMLYRLPSILAGTATALVAASLARRWGVTSMLVVLVVMSFSHPLIHYTSEARGYAVALLCAFAALTVLEKFLVYSKFTLAALFSLICVLGVLSHLLFLQVYIALLIWSVYHALRSDHPWSLLFTVLSRAHLLPLIAIAYLYVFHLRHLWIAGGPSRDLVQVITSAASLFCGLEGAGTIGVIALVVLAGVLMAGLYILKKLESTLSLFFVSLIVIIPAIMLVVARPEALFERYFLFNGAFLLFLGAIVLSRLLLRSGVLRWAAIAILIAFLTTNGHRTLNLIRLGRGHYRDLIRYLDTHSPEGEIAITGDQNFRHQMMFNHYARVPVTERTIQYIGFYTLPREGVRWFLMHSREQKAIAAPECHDRFGNSYELVTEFRSDVLSGYHLFLYHAQELADGSRQSAPAPPPASTEKDHDQ